MTSPTGNLLMLMLIGLALLIAAAGMWFGMQHHYARKLDAARRKYERQKQDANAALLSAQDQLAACRQELLEAQLALKKANRSRPAEPAGDARQAVESLLLMLDNESEQAQQQAPYAKTVLMARPSKQDSAQERS